MIKANCRDRFTAADFEFLVRTLSRTGRDSTSLVELLTNAEARDSILDDPLLFEKVLGEASLLAISPQLYFYTLVRHVLKETGINDRALSDYVASLLEGFSRSAGMRSPADGRDTPIQYVSDMLIALQNAPPQQTFHIRAHIGNYSLFISGILRETVESRSQRGAPSVNFYEAAGRASYRCIAGHPVARSAALGSIYEALAEGFHDIRLALNRLSDSLLHLDDGHAPRLIS